MKILGTMSLALQEAGGSCFNYFTFLPNQLQLLSIEGKNGINSLNVLTFSVSYTQEIVCAILTFPTLEK